jgi:hypothetical protein
MNAHPSRLLLAIIGISVALSTASAEDRKWVTIKGQVLWDGAVPKQAPPNAAAAQGACVKDKNAVLTEDYIVDPKSKGLKDVFVWIQPTGAAKGAPFPANDIHPKLAKPDQAAVSIDQPCCRFIPHVLAARVGQQLTIDNSAPFAHNARWTSENNGNFNPLIVAGGKFALPKPLVAESGRIDLACNLHPWLTAYVRVFDHPYFAVSDADGRFEIKLAPTGNFSLFVYHPTNAYLDGALGKKGKPYALKGDLDVGALKMKENKN